MYPCCFSFLATLFSIPILSPTFMSFLQRHSLTHCYSPFGSVSNCCCPTDILPVSTTYYKPQYDQIYVAGSGSGVTRGLVFIPDIFGPHPNAYQVADRLANRGFLVVMPDFFHGTHWTLETFPPVNGFDSPEWTGFLAKLTYENMKPIVQKGIDILRSLGATSIASVGFCWGGGIAIQALTDGLVIAAASPHPSFLTTDIMSKIQGPVCILPTRDDGELLDMKEAAESTGHKVVYQYFDDVHHGFCSARANFEDELNRTRANQALDIMTKFFDEAFVSSSSP
jgi:dienelactone hydrolase